MALSAVALISLLVGLAVPAAASFYEMLVILKFPMLGVILVGAFLDKSRWWLGNATLAYMCCFLGPMQIGLAMLILR